MILMDELRDEITFDLFKMAESNARVVNGKHTIHDLENIQHII